MKKRVLVVGGAGYIGSHAAMALDAAGYDVLVFDNLSTGHAEFLRFGRFVEGDLADRAALDRVLEDGDIHAIMHFAAFINVGESTSDPGKYYRNNLASTLNLLEAVRDHGVDNFIFSSTCATYGTPLSLPLREDHPQNPINPYGRAKLAVEWMMRDFASAYGLRYCIMRYFNAAGAAPASLGARIGEWHEPETHLIPLLLRAALRPGGEAEIFGTDYATKDGTCIRDYIHVCDLADAHVLAMERLAAGEPGTALNLGNGRGFSVLELVECVQEVTGLQVRVRHSPRRPGDAEALVGDASGAVSELGWKPKFADLKAIVRSAYDWEKQMQARMPA
ncbi:MAG: UDP-glucose 4-epimerase GalE [Desulfovibrio sp.]|jgi:UDP-glucose-4-epimerase GalE|nr:UDP-glucose 4-epimerase GalE [Desulfovibrio sp.]